MHIDDSWTKVAVPNTLLAKHLREAPTRPVHTQPLGDDMTIVYYLPRFEEEEKGEEEISKPSPRKKSSVSSKKKGSAKS